MGLWISGFWWYMNALRKHIMVEFAPEDSMRYALKIVCLRDVLIAQMNGRLLLCFWFMIIRAIR
jgi:hypothetical protein